MVLKFSLLNAGPHVARRPRVLVPMTFLRSDQSETAETLGKNVAVTKHGFEPRQRPVQLVELGYWRFTQYVSAAV
jgi:hypothetical protein